MHRNAERKVLRRLVGCAADEDCTAVFGEVPLEVTLRANVVSAFLFVFFFFVPCGSGDCR